MAPVGLDEKRKKKKEVPILLVVIRIISQGPEESTTVCVPDLWQGFWMMFSGCWSGIMLGVGCIDFRPILGTKSLDILAYAAFFPHFFVPSVADATFTFFHSYMSILSNNLKLK